MSTLFIIGSVSPIDLYGWTDGQEVEDSTSGDAPLIALPAA